MTTDPVEDVFVAALDVAESERAAFVAERCGDDVKLRARVERLLAAHSHTLADRFLEPRTVPDLPRALRPAAKLGRYAILDEIGRGGMGVVYAAYDPDLQREIAVKQVLAHGHDRLELEARALARLQHPNVVAVHDVGRAGDQVYIAMELVDGESLSQWAKAHDTLDVLRVLAAAGKGLSHAHHAGILHRDFKPANVLVDRTGRARVVDFGLAADAAAAAREATVMGTPGYMAPEIEEGKPASVASDVFAYCRALERLVVARSDTPAWLAPIVARGLADAPGERWPDLDALLQALDAELGIDPRQDPRTGREHRRRVYVLVAALLLVVPLVPVAFGKPLAIDIRDLFYYSLVPAIAIPAIALGFWRAMRATEFNRRGVETLLIVVAAILLAHALALQLAASVAWALCTDLLIVTAFLLGRYVHERERVILAAALLCAAGAVAAALFPAQAPLIFAIVTILQLPAMYLAWAAKR